VVGVIAESGARSADGLRNPVKVHEALAQGGELASQAVSDWPCRTACKAAAVACNCCQSGVFGSFMAMAWSGIHQ